MPIGIYPRKPLKERFFSFVKKTKGCWKWKGAKCGKGYGEIGAGHGYKMAHRVSYELHYGPIPKGLCVLHRCDNPPCANPKHLFIGTKGDNNRDAVLKGRHRLGVNHHATTLSEVEVRAIKQYGKEGKIPLLQLSKIFKTSEMTIHNIVKNRTWRHIKC